jgi:hypothetical protein
VAGGGAPLAAAAAAAIEATHAIGSENSSRMEKVGSACVGCLVAAAD